MGKKLIKFDGLETHEPIATPVAGTSTGNASATNTNKHTTTVVPENERKLPPPIFLKITEDYRVHLKTVTNFMPKLRNKMSGEYIKLCCDTHDQFYSLNNFLENKTDFEFYSITPKHLRPIKVVIKGLPKNSKTTDIHQDLLDLGFTVERVSQLTGRITNEPLPVFLITLPRNIDNAKIFKVDKLANITVTVEGYESKGITQCYKCQKFNHTASNCHIKPRCLKCGEAHQTAQCLIQKVENLYCINCKTYGHMANYSKCPLFPKPRKGKFEKPNYSSIVESIVRPNLTFAQAAKQSRITTQATVPQQMAPRNVQFPATTLTQAQTAQRQIHPQPQPINTNNDCLNLITQTLNQTIQALSLLVQQIGVMTTAQNTPNPATIKKSREELKKEMYALYLRVPPRSDNRLFTLDLETILQINSNCVIFGDFNATHSAWNCSHNSTRGTQLKTFTDATNLEIAFPASHTRYGYNSANTLDFALISNFNFPYTIESISELSSDHNPVMLSFNLNSSIHKNNSRAITTCWSAFKIHLKNHFHLSDYANINNPTMLENKIAKFTDAVSSAHSHASEPITATRHSYTPQHIKQIITLKNRARKLYQRTLNPTHKTEANRLQAILKREIKIHKQNTWATKLASLEPQDNSLWQMQKHLRKKRSNIPNLTSPSGIASTDNQKANLIANTSIDNYTENKRPGNFTTNIDSDVTNTIRNFFATPPTTPTPPTNPVD
ncbi:nucleic-acid-binding protein from transposon X-element [Trichonephila clavipes]|nr:nucleic-acid-binding protein from transposon X-element [Trichonephila clavipes]